MISTLHKKITKDEIDLKTLERISEKKKIKNKSYLFGSKIFTYAILIFWALLCLYPFFWSLFTSFKSPYTISLTGINPFPNSGEWTATNYTSLFSGGATSRYVNGWITNSVIYCSITSILNATFNILGGYALARIAMKGKRPIIYYFIVSILVPSQATFLPSYKILQDMGIISKNMPATFFIILVTFSGMANIILTFMARQFFLTQSDEMEEAAKMDGYSSMSLFFRITLRKMLPLFTTQFVMVFMGSWNNFLMFKLYAVGDPNKFTLMSGIYLTIQSAIDQEVGYGQSLALSNISFVPMIVIYLISLKIQLRGIKGGSK